MIPFIKLHTRRFHITSKIFLRKIGPKSSSSDHKREFPISNFDSSSSCQSSHPDYLGIESDENVITVYPQKHTLQQPPQKVDTREKFYRASFGVVRFDADNEPKYHGQFRKKIGFVFPHSSSDYVKVSNISEISSSENQRHQNLSLKSSQKVSAANRQIVKINEPILSEENCHNINYVDECNIQFGTSESQNNIQQTISEELNYLEKDYFETIVHPKDTSFQENASIDITSKANNNFTVCNTTQVEELNYLEKDYFETLNNSENLFVKEDSSDYTSSRKIDSSLLEKDQSEEYNYIEKDYFKTSDNSEINYMNKNISIYTNNEEKNNSTFDVKDLNNSSKSSNFTSAVDELNFYETCSMSNVENSPCCNDLLKSSSHFKENNYIHNQDISNKCNERNQGGKIKNQNEVTDSIFTDDSINALIQKQAFKVDFKKLSSDKIEKSDTMSNKKLTLSGNNLNMPKDIGYNDNHLDKQFSAENNFKFSKLISEVPDANNTLPSAHDFVKKLRHKQKIPSLINISKDKKTDEEKFDSKGFRILKNQVPNLAYFTHDEILTLLKQNIVYSDDDLLILNKPYSLIMHESKTTKEPCLSAYLDDLAKEIDQQATNPKLFTVHRLDKETTGCLLLARSETMAMHLKALFVQRKIVKKYWIITAGVPDPLEGVIDMPISEGSIDNRKRMVLNPKLPKDIQYKNHSKNGKPAVTTYKVIAESGNAALIEVFPKTGVKHQIRVHFGFGLGCPVLGDHKYSHLDKLVPQKLPSDMLQKLHVRQSNVRHIPMHIHAKSVGIPDYFPDRRDLFVNIPIPDYFKLNLKRLKFRKKDMTY